MLRQIEWWVQNGPIAKNGVLPVTTLSFWKFCFSLRTHYKELIWCTNDPNVHIHTFRKRCSLVWGYFVLWALWVSLICLEPFFNFPLGEIISRGRPKDVPKKGPDVLRTSPYGPICNAKGRILSGTSLGRTEDENLTKIHKMDFYGFFSIFPDSNCIQDIALQK